MYSETSNTLYGPVGITELILYIQRLNVLCPLFRVFFVKGSKFFMNYKEIPNKCHKISLQQFIVEDWTLQNYKIIINYKIIMNYENQGRFKTTKMWFYTH